MMTWHARVSFLIVDTFVIEIIIRLNITYNVHKQMAGLSTTDFFMYSISININISIFLG